jgi:hypothetical protein
MNNLNKWQIAVVLGVLLTISACSSLSKNGENTSSLSSSPSTMAPTFSASADPRADVVKSLKASLDVKSYRTRITTTNSGGGGMNMTAEFVAPNRAHITQDINLSDGSNIKKEWIFVGKDYYIKAEGGSWQKSPMDMGDLLTQFRDPKLIETITEKAEVKYLGTDTLNGAPMLTYQYTVKDLLGKGSVMVTKSWIGATDGLPHQTESENDMDLGTGKMIHSKVNTTIYDYNADIKIELPM